VIETRIEKQRCIVNVQRIFESLAHAHDLSSSHPREQDEDSLMMSPGGASSSTEEGSIEMVGIGPNNAHFARRDEEMAFESTVGVIDAGDRTKFERMIFRRMRGNCFVAFEQFEMPAGSKDRRERCVYCSPRKNRGTVLWKP
jgi:hypothetical protein